MIKYQTTKNGIEIQKVEVTRESKSSIWLLSRTGEERCERKISEYYQYHDTWESAYQYILYMAKSKLRQCRSALESAEVKLKEVENMVRE